MNRFSPDRFKRDPEISKMEERLDILRNEWKSGSIEYELYVNAWRKIATSGFRVKCIAIDGKCIHLVKPRKMATCAPLKVLNTNPHGKIEGDCTTRALAYCFPNIGYDKLRKRQEETGAKMSKTWCNTLVWTAIAEKNGDYAFFKMTKKRTRARVAAVLKTLKSPVFARSNGHVAIVHKGEVVDTWDSRCGKVTMIGVKRAEAAEARALIDTLN